MGYWNSDVTGQVLFTKTENSIVIESSESVYFLVCFVVVFLIAYT